MNKKYIKYESKRLAQATFFLSCSLLISVLSLHAQKSYVPGTVAGLPAVFTPNARIVTGDFDGDGDKDILYQNGNIPGVDIHYLRNNSNSSLTAFNASGLGVFPAGTPFGSIPFTLIVDPDKSTTGQPIGQRVFDYDGDGDQDILEIKTTGTPRLLLLNAGVYTVSAISSSFPASLASSVSRWVMADVDSDGDDDVLYQSGNTINTDIHLLRNDHGGVWTKFDASASGLFTTGPLTGISFSRIGNTADVLQFFIDIDGDGDKDLYELTPSGNRYFTRNGAVFASGSLPANLPTSLSPTIFRMTAADYDKDGDIDFFYQASNTSMTNIRFVKNNHNNTFTLTTANPATGVFAGPNTPFGPAAFNFVSRAATNREQLLLDVDGDADLDMLQVGTLATSVLLQTGTNLPIKLDYFTVAKRGFQVEVKWKTSEEINVDHFIIEHSLDAFNFRTLEQVKSSGNSAGALYNYIDKTPAKGLQYYRLVEYDLDGTATYFPIKSIQFDELKKLVEVYPNIVTTSVTAYFKQSTFKQVQLVDGMGRIVDSKAIIREQAEVTFDVSARSAGIYYLKFIGDESSITERIIKR